MGEIERDGHHRNRPLRQLEHRRKVRVIYPGDQRGAIPHLHLHHLKFYQERRQFKFD